MAARKSTKESKHTPVLDALNDAVRQAKHLGSDDLPAIEAARALARKIDLADEYFDHLADYAADHESRPPSQDNVSIPSFLKYCESLGLTPAGRAKLAEQKTESKGGSKLGKYQSAVRAKRKPGK